MRTGRITLCFGSRRWRSWAASICRSRRSGSRSVAASTSWSTRNAMSRARGASSRSCTSSPSRAPTAPTSCGRSSDSASRRACRRPSRRGAARAGSRSAAARARARHRPTRPDAAARAPPRSPRPRLALEEERAALTAQGRASALVLVALAPLGTIFFSFATPDYFSVLLDRGQFLVALAILLEAAGAFWLSHILRSRTAEADFASLLDAVIVGLDAGLTFEHALGALVAGGPALSRLPEARRLLADLALGQSSRVAFEAFGKAGPTEARVAALVRSATRFGSPLAELLVTQADVVRSTERL